ncbi:DUF192 domain-containing protein [Actomonas aquatica]|uniref:DUF192 domain-containing protein n=1 Tax=Actomonas aquatica TaxID=2866162 RepID=A0ABZ1CDU8_9BACT|nr:DUF192 domain-containing protein [Opitutus sp. WL0086]WRQ88809.1 DUF192 domain-containing protein [Opitutus sp. WL0086]
MLTACGQTKESETVAPKTVQDWFSISVGDTTVDMQLAMRMTEMQRGLMGRTDLTDRQGMLFLYREPQVLSFWMRNTPTALDIGFFTNDGVLREVYPMYPYDETSVRSFRDDVQYALELKQGGFAELGIKLGDKLDLAALKAAVEARGFRVHDYAGLEDVE